MTQKEKIVARLNKVGYVDNFWAIDNYILRLGAIIHQLSKGGLKTVGLYGYELGKPKKLKMMRFLASNGVTVYLPIDDFILEVKDDGSGAIIVRDNYWFIGKDEVNKIIELIKVIE